MNLSYSFIVIGLLAIIAELALGVLTGFDLLLIGVAFLLSGIVGVATGSWQIAVLLLCVLSPLMIFVGRRYTKKALQFSTHKTNTDTLVGSTGVVEQAISANRVGRVRIGSEVWRAESDQEIAVNETARVISISGITVFVQQNKEENV